jgi:hypothetical protein
VVGGKRFNAQFAPRPNCPMAWVMTFDLGDNIAPEITGYPEVMPGHKSVTGQMKPR